MGKRQQHTNQKTNESQLLTESVHAVSLVGDSSRRGGTNWRGAEGNLARKAINHEIRNESGRA